MYLSTLRKEKPLAQLPQRRDQPVEVGQSPSSITATKSHNWRKKNPSTYSYSQVKQDHHDLQERKATHLGICKVIFLFCLFEAQHLYHTFFINTIFVTQTK